MIKDNESFSSLFWDVQEHDDTSKNDLYSLSISSSEWKLSPNQCTPYEIRIQMNLTPEVKHTNCFDVGFTASVGA